MSAMRNMKNRSFWQRGQNLGSTQNPQGSLKNTGRVFENLRKEKEERIPLPEICC